MFDAKASHALPTQPKDLDASCGLEIKPPDTFGNKNTLQKSLDKSLLAGVFWMCFAQAFLEHKFCFNGLRIMLIHQKAGHKQHNIFHR